MGGDLVSSGDGADPRDALVPGFRSASVCLDASVVLELVRTVRLFVPAWCDALVAFGAHGAAVIVEELECLDTHGAGVLAGPAEGTPGIDEGLCSVVVGILVDETCNSRGQHFRSRVRVERPTHSLI